MLARMPAALPLPKPRGLAAVLGWRRVLTTFGVCLALIGLLSTVWESGVASLAIRVLAVGGLAMLVFGLFEQSPARLPRWLARWVLQVLMVGLTIPLALTAVYVLSTEAGAPAFWRVEKRVSGFGMLTFLGVLVAP